MFKRLFLIGFLSVVGLMLWQTRDVSAATLTVCAAGCNHTSIADAFAVAADGDVVEVVGGGMTPYASSTETFSLNFPNGSTTLMCTGGAVIGQASALPAALNQIFLRTNSTIRDCTFGNVKLSSHASGADGFQILNNTFSTTTTSTIDFFFPANEFLIEGNTNLSAMVIVGSSEGGVIRNNDFYGRTAWNAGIMLNTSSSTSDLSVINNRFLNYATSATMGASLVLFEGQNITFATNTVRYANDPSQPPRLDRSVGFSASGTGRITGNLIQGAPTSTCGGIDVYPNMSAGATWSAQIAFERNTIVNTCGRAVSISDGGGAAYDAMDVDFQYNLFVLRASEPGGKAIESNGPNIVLTGARNNYYNFTGFDIVSGGATSTFTGTLNQYPYLKDRDADVANDLELAPFSPLLDIDGAQDVGATIAERRGSIRLSASGTVDYIATTGVDATSTTFITDVLRSGDTLTLLSGVYQSFTVSSTHATTSLTIQGAVGANPIIHAGAGENGIVLSGVTSSAISRLTVQNASSSIASYFATRMTFSFDGTIYDDGNDDIELSPTSTLLIPTADCEAEFIQEDGYDMTTAVGDATQDFNLALIDLGGAKTVVIARADAVPTAASFPMVCGMGVVDAFVTSTFSVSDGVYTYNAAAVAAAGVTLAPATTDPPAITRTQTANAGIKLLQSGNIAVNNVTSTLNGYGLWLSSGVASTTMYNGSLSNNVLYDVFTSSASTNTLDNVSFTRSSSSVSGAGGLLVNYFARVHAYNATSAAGIVTSVTGTSALSSSTSLGSTAEDGYTGYVRLPAHIITTASSSLTHGGYNPYTFQAAAVPGRLASSTVATLSTPDQTIEIALLSDAAPSAPSDIALSSVGTSTIVVAWTDNASDETSYLIDYVNVLTGQSFPGTTTTIATNTTSTVISGLTPGGSYRFRVAAVGEAGTSGHSTSSAIVLLVPTPTSLTVTGLSSTSLSVALGSTSNATSAEYAIYSSTLSRFLTAAGGMSEAAEWHATSGWSVLTVSGLTCNASYAFAVVARNSEGVQSATSSAASVTTSGCPSTGGGGGGGGGGGLPTTTPTYQVVYYVNGQATTTPPVATAPSSTSPVVIPVTSPTSTPTVPTSSGPIPQRIINGVREDAREFRVTPTEQQTDFFARFIFLGTIVTQRLGEGERRALVRDIFEAMQRTDVPAADLDRMTRGEIPLTRNLAAERQRLPDVLRIFRAIYGRQPQFQNAEENLAWNTLMYRIRFTRDLAAEREGIADYRRLFGRNPASPLDWAAVRVLGYIQ